MNSLISLSGISKQYRTKSGTVTALDGIDLQIAQSSFTAITGRSGSGKSTLMNILGCLDRPDRGEYLLDSVPVSSMKERELSFVRNRIIGFVFQSFNLIPTLTARENVELPLLYRRMKRSRRRELSDRALAMVGLEGRMTHKPRELSGGQQQRVAIARALAAEPKLILADEPTGNLDSSSGSEIMDILSRLHQNGTTVVLITHDEKVAAMAQHRIRIADGRITG